jgi:hypothetical protein
MIGRKSNFYKNALLDAMFSGTPFTFPSTMYLALMTTVPDDTGPGTEVTGNNYARVPVTLTRTSDGYATNLTVIIMNEPTPAAIGPIVGFGLFDTLTENTGDMYYWGECGPYTILPLQIPTLDIGNLIITEN